MEGTAALSKKPKQEERNMSKSRFFVAMVAVALAASLAVADTAFAQKKEKEKKITKEEAWSRCTAEVSVIPSDQHGQRYARGAACMKKYGHRI